MQSEYHNFTFCAMAVEGFKKNNNPKFTTATNFACKLLITNQKCFRGLIRYLETKYRSI